MKPKQQKEKQNKTREEYYSNKEIYTRISGEKEELRMDIFVEWARHRTTKFYYKHVGI